MSTATFNPFKGVTHAPSNQQLSPSVILWWNCYCHRLRGGRAFAHLNLRILLATLTLFAVNQFVLKSMTDNLIIQSYFNDSLALLILLPYSNLLLGLYPGRDMRLLHPLPILVFTLLVGLFWEVVTPLYLARSVGDVWDLAAFGVGGVMVCLILACCSKQYELT